jgi:hypothetical protein
MPRQFGMLRTCLCNLQQRVTHIGVNAVTSDGDMEIGRS